MKKIKLIILLFSLLLLSGCSADYDLEIHNDLSVSDKGYGNPSDSIYKDPSVSLEDRVANVVRSNIDSVNDLGYQYAVLDGGNLLQFSNNFESLEEYKNDNQYVYQQWFKDLKITNDGKIVTIEATDFYPYNLQDPDKLVIEDLSINITLPFKVVETNADVVYKDSLTYTWKINDTTLDKSIILKFDSSQNLKLRQNYVLISVLGGLLTIIVIAIIFFSYKVKTVNKI